MTNQPVRGYSLALVTQVSVYPVHIVMLFPAREAEGGEPHAWLLRERPPVSDGQAGEPTTLDTQADKWLYKRSK